LALAAKAKVICSLNSRLAHRSIHGRVKSVWVSN
jgi:hypothetical protein